MCVKAGDIIKRYIIERAIISMKLTIVAFVVPFVLSLLTLGRRNGYMLLLMIMGMAAIYFLLFMLPCIRFVIMILRQEKEGYHFESGEVYFLSKNITGIYLGTEWLIYAGSVALHYTQCKRIYVSPNRFGRLRYVIVVETIDDRIYKWPLSQRNVKIVQDWLKRKKA